MEAYAYQLLNIEQFTSLALSWVIMTVSAAAAVALTKSQWKLGRAGYFLSMGFIVLLAGMTNLLALGVPEAIKNGYLAVIVSAIYGVLVPIGGLAGIFAAARSMDAHGTREKWFLGFIPLANLLLLFAKPTASSKRGAVQLLRTIGVVSLGIALIGIGKGLEQIVEQNIQQAIPGIQADAKLQSKKMEYEVKNKGIENYLNEVASLIPVPAKIDNITTLKSVQSDYIVLRYTYEISDKSANLGKTWKDLMMSRWCSQEEFKPLFDAGALVTGHYVDMAGNTLAEISASSSLCSTWSEALDAEFKASAQSVKVPMKIDEVTTVTEATYESKTYSYHYTVSEIPPDLWKDAIKADWCASRAMRAITDLGVTVRGVYTLENGTPIGEVSIDKTACPAS